MTFDDEMETGVVKGAKYRDKRIHIIPTLCSKVRKCYQPWVIWIPRAREDSIVRSVWLMVCKVPCAFTQPFHTRMSV